MRNGPDYSQLIRDVPNVCMAVNLSNTVIVFATHNKYTVHTVYIEAVPLETFYLVNLEVLSERN